ncbi:dihydrofolate reductase family protein [Flavobacterium sp. DG1-102-2]|uniref:dihydrofolate reductase family protein n=1 Tax=Flavobacterium sp. DG1-102-2 TaxID=3081663 RepID=UPI002949BDFD|nr:dihydrofolate reductase family protein [Flavobacterium sp. DG1-102-2]MDV6168274.1 dihydrofolate reductase family protein [Flavobacterium sp. DG1-102-2]
MRKVIAQEWISADGFATDRNGTTRFFEDPKFNDGFEGEQIKLFDRIDAAVLGGETYKMFSQFWPTAEAEKEPIAPKLNALTKIVFSKTIKEKEAVWHPAIIRTDDAAHGVRELKMQEGKDLIIWGSLSIVKRLAQENLIDEYWLIIVPTFLGKGKKFLTEDTEIHNMELFDSITAPSGAVFLKYRPQKKE